MHFEGYIEKLIKKDGTKANGQKWFKHSFILSDGETESGWIGTDFNVQFPAKEGDYLTLEAEEDRGGYLVVKKGTAKIVKDPPAKKGKSTPAGNDASATGGSAKNAVVGYQNARTAAIQIVTLALENKALPVTKTDSKAGEATRYQQILDAIDKLTVRLYHDADTLRLLDSVADEGAVVEASETPNEDAEGQVEDAADFDVDDDVAF